MGVVGQPYAPVASTPGKDMVPILQDAGWSPGPIWTGGKSRPYVIRSRTVQLVVSRYTE